MSLTFRFSLLSQLLDDLNDRMIDQKEGNFKVFIAEDINLDVRNTLLYIWDIKEYLEKQDIQVDNKQELLFSNHLSFYISI